MKKKRLTLSNKRAITGLLFIAPWLIGFIVYYLKSLILTVQFSLSEVSIGETGGYHLDFTGLDNFKYALLQHGTYNQILVQSLIDVVVDVVAIIFFSLFIAILLNQNFKGRTLVRLIFFLPIIMNAGAINDAIETARTLLQGGATVAVGDAASAAGVNMDYFLSIFIDLGVPDGLIGYITDLVARIYEIIRASGVQIIIFIAALQSVPGALYEVSKIEGATAYETFWKVTFPMVSPLILTNVVYTIVDSFVTSDVVETAYNTAFTQYNYGLSSAMSILSTVLVCFILVVTGAIISKKTFYYN
ncbi:carbohydrate ABC transporter permease [Anaeromicropila populeti]|uniref:Carbohydrate ABC transporter membrane protein 1, CUT1 family (TC 3.A.1.1.-) n=1 Tax=Anaeromicropila populeti TaxID=37658 RepID=A0A1I6LK11_9FIRM|nr:sugar ABC transporter permease [Anaeromicropila populeti]SFS03753.1 carbohydrate ABC transporter membrane protein 1, CUT1 family (TC 3.A.1.1.-) [Anaeromicropila populeti]